MWVVSNVVIIWSFSFCRAQWLYLRCHDTCVLQGHVLRKPSCLDLFLVAVHYTAIGLARCCRSACSFLCVSKGGETYAVVDGKPHWGYFWEQVRRCPKKMMIDFAHKT